MYRFLIMSLFYHKFFVKIKAILRIEKINWNIGRLIGQSQGVSFQMSPLMLPKGSDFKSGLIPPTLAASHIISSGWRSSGCAETGLGDGTSRMSKRHIWLEKRIVHLNAFFLYTICEKRFQNADTRFGFFWCFWRGREDYQGAQWKKPETLEDSRVSGSWRSGRDSNWKRSVSCCPPM